MYDLGICVGASSVSLVLIDKNNHVEHYTELHEGNPAVTLVKLLKKVDINKVGNALVTGRKFKELINLDIISEPEAIESAIELLGLKGYDSVVSAGGENFIVYSLDKNARLSKAQTGNKCASGTGEFFFQQITRMGIDLDQAVEFGLKGTPHEVSGRCSVFCKSDCTHAMNRGEPKKNVVSGLCLMMADKVIELLSKIKHEKVLFIGGVSRNKVMLQFLKKKIPDLHIPKQATYFEALGAAYSARKLKPGKKLNLKELFIKGKSAFTFHRPLKEFVDSVEFKSMEFKKAKKDDVCIIGLDVGSTTTKAIILRVKDNAILAGSYLRTDGDPVAASVNCYKEINSQIDVPIQIIGLGVTGSGRKIAGLHALTKGIINEIIAHATAAAFFDEEVDTIFEIGGQDAKYTYLTSSVPSDYAMNEACSAGTGSFLEESAKESLGLDYTEIADIAMKAKHPPNFNDQCAAFISSDIKNAAHEGLSKEDIVAGLVYSICMNYANRVKGNRPSGKKIFMQGGVCYNKAVPVAMAALTGKKIIVPPEPGLIGAFGVALEIKKRIELSLIEKQEFSLKELIDRKVIYHNSFKCMGDKTSCDRSCKINLVEVNGRKYAFGGACNKYYNQLLDIKCDSESNDYVSIRQKLVYEKYASLKPKEPMKTKVTKPKRLKTVGITKSFLTNTYYPLYYNFFTKLGMKVILADDVNQKGIDKVCSSFCYPAEISHGLFYDLLKKNPDYIFLPHITEVEVKNEDYYKRVCVFVQGEPYYLKTSFKDMKLPKLLRPVFSFREGIEKAEKDFIKLALDLGFTKDAAKKSFDYALKQQRQMFDEFKQLGREVLERVKKEKKFAIVLFGRPYNAFTKEANMGIPRKFASRNRIVIPYDFLPFENEKSFHHMYWGLGGMLLRAASYVKKNPLLFGCFITNFSCGPDSFLITYFRDEMGVKPSLTLELDSHSADAGINTRVEAALDIMQRYIQLVDKGLIKEKKQDFVPAKVVLKTKKAYVRVDNKNIPLTDPRVTLVLPSMGELGTNIFAAAFRRMNINCKALPVPNMEILATGRANTTCKECLPLILTTGNMLHYLKKRDENEITVFFMPSGAGPCRQGQYHVFQQGLVKKLKLKNVAVLTVGDEKSVSGFGVKFLTIIWMAMIAVDCLEDIRSTLRVLAKDKEKAIKIFDHEFKKIITILESKPITGFFKQLSSSAKEFSKIPLTKPLSEAKFISLIGEIYVRREEFSRLDLISTLEKKGFIALPTHTAEYAYYVNYVRKKGLRHATKRNILKVRVADFGAEQLEKKVRKTLAKSGLLPFELIEVSKTVDHAKHLVSPKLLGESILTIGTGLREIIHKSCGVISIGPFACMPSRLVESILTQEMNLKGKNKASKQNHKFEASELPFLAIETDGNIFPQIVQSRLEIFMLQANRLHQEMMTKHV